MDFCMKFMVATLCCFVNLNVLVSSESDQGKIVELQPPADVTLASVGEKNAFIFWYPPQIFEVHNSNVTPPKDYTRHCLQLTQVTMANITVPDPKTLANAEESGMIGDLGVLKHVTLNKTLTDISKTDNKADNNVYLHEAKTTHTEPHEVIKWYFAKKHVPAACAHVRGYFIAWKKNGTDEVMLESVGANVTEFNITGLEPNTLYQFNVSAFYYTLTQITSQTYEFTTGTNPDKGNECICNQTFSQHGCNMDTRPCTCNRGYTGVFCELCAPRHYRLQPHLPCFSCPCDLIRSSGTCKMDEGYLYCDYCNPGYSGSTCSKCAFGYYRYQSSCIKCQCNNNSDTCDGFTGRCLVCRYNTTGFSCQRCIHGYIGDAKSQRKCIHRSDLKLALLSPGLIAGICVAVILALSALVGCVVYRKWRNFPIARPFWTVELKDDHEGVNFSNIPEDDLTHREMEDLEFYKDQGGQRNKKGEQKYAPLHETA